MAGQSAIRVMRELKRLGQGDQLAMTVAYSDANIREIRALILGPPETPYAFGFYQFAISIPIAYPSKPPIVKLTTTNFGQTRFGPNLYADGKVCLSILGTWSGSSGEQWSPAQGLESVLLSIQSLLSANPYLNEPGFEDSDGEHHGAHIELYKAKIRHENLRLAVIQPVEEAFGIYRTAALFSTGRFVIPQQRADPNGPDDDESLDRTVFDDFCKRRFLCYLDLYKQAVEDGVVKEAARHHQPFEMVQFESPSNQMAGIWDYPDLQHRLKVLEDKVMEETHNWPKDGHKLVKDEAPIAMKLQGQYEQAVAELGRRKGAMVDLRLEEDNPFLWNMTYFGSPATLFDGGVVTVKVYISPRHPAEQPRVFLASPLFHVSVSSNGALIYLPTQADEMWRHLEGIIASLEEVFPPSNPLMAVNTEAAKLCWGSKDDQKQYSRKLRRSIEATVE